MTSPRSATAVDCYVRASSLVEPVDSTVERLREFDRRGVIDELRVEAWPDDVPLDGAPEHSAIVGRFETFQTWADGLGASIEPAFTVRERTTLVADEIEAVLVLPVVCLAIHVDGELASVVPHTKGTTTYTVDDALAELEARDAPSTRVRDPSADRPPGPTAATKTRWHWRCPACGKELANGQGLYACSTCSWVGIDPTEIGAATLVTAPSPDGDADDQEPVESEESPDRRSDEQPPRPPT